MHEEQKEKILVTAALPYVNNIPHIGNISGSHLPADIFARFSRINGKEVLFIGGSDEHGTPIEVSANKLHITPKELCDHYYEIHKKIYSWFNFSYDNFSRTSKKIHHETTKKIFLEIQKNGFISREKIKLPRCAKCERVLPDRYVEGTCPHCGYEKARGDQCEICGRLLDPEDLKNPKCAICDSSPEFVEREHLFFDLNKLESKLREWIESKRDVWKENVINESLGWIKEGLKKRCITRDTKWGVSVPLEDFKDKVFYVWFDAPIGYISFTAEIGKEEFWKGKAKIYHFVGKDNIPFHTIFWPSILLADKNYDMPYNVVGLQYLNYEGKKISKSAGWGIFCDKLLTSEMECDIWRYYLTFLIPESSDTEWKWEEFYNKVNNELIANLGNFVFRTLSFIKKNFGGKISRNIDSEGLEVIKEVRKKVEEYRILLENLKFRDGMKKILEIGDIGNKYMQKKQPWKTFDKSTLYVCACICYYIAIVIYPYLPETSHKIFKQMGIKEDVKISNVFEEKPYFEINDVKPLFKKIDKDMLERVKSHVTKIDEKIDECIKENFVKENTVKENTSNNIGSNNIDNVSYEDFMKLKLKVGLVENAEKIENSNKLLKLTVDVGEEKKRTIVAGIGKFYSCSEIIGKKVIVVTNLKPKKIANLMSEGMLLAAGGEDEMVVLTVEGKLKPGTDVR